MTAGQAPGTAGRPCGAAREAPGAGEAVHDAASDRVGRVTGHEGPYVRIRPLGGGRAWDATADDLRVLTQDELLSALVAEVNTRSGRRP
ncbi:hypothetical protein [Streptomyces tropicalis]|uniref:Uncharacterized protein n=1 Tax=Streptomyces tropicalis TaxID=3034234 RepID=A0ABT6A184_9ACTN|nr:hypothetical protein [Streptomyces tropicalis]MDF3298407.1 hypothetical protein [Streptomyces tropicalis]